MTYHYAAALEHIDFVSQYVAYQARVLVADYRSASGSRYACTLLATVLKRQQAVVHDARRVAFL
jgi:hypothetical protein